MAAGIPMKGLMKNCFAKEVVVSDLLATFGRVASEGVAQANFCGKRERSD
jgi:hypothetical protein